MDINNKNTIDPKDPYFDTLKANTTISFDIVLWLFRILKYWYLFVISVFLCFGIAYLKNKSWVPYYSAQAVIMLESRGNASVMGTAVPWGTILGNTENQRFLLGSYGMTERTVKRLPKKMFVDYFRTTTFKTMLLYGDTPVEVVIEDLTDEAYNYVFNIASVDDNTCRVYYDAKNSGEENFSVDAKYGQEITDKRFKIKIEKTHGYNREFEPFSFRFLSKAHLTGMYHGRVTSALRTKEGSALNLMIGGNDPNRDLDYLNALLEEFQTYNLDLKNYQADLTIVFLTKQLKIISDSLHSARTALDLFQKETGVYEVTSVALRTEIEEAEKEKQDLAIKERGLLIFAEKVNEAILGDSKILEPEEIGISIGELSSLVRSYNGVIDGAKLMGAKSPLFNKTVEELNTFRAGILKELQRSLNTLQDQKDLLIDKYKLLDLKVDNLPPQERDLVKYEREYRVNEMYHQFLTQKRYEAEIQKASNTPDNFIWEYPRGSGGPGNSGDMHKTYLFWIVLGLVIPLGFVVLKEEVFNYTIATKEECEKLSGLPVLGTIENVASKLKNSGIVLVRNYPKSSFAEAFRNIRVRLEYMAQRQNNISVLVTSAEPADGKTFIATNIASVYQLTNKKVVLLDLDLRRPSVAKTLQLDTSNKGVSNFLIGQVELADIIYSHPELGFDVIPAGTLPPNPSELIKTARTRDLLKHLKEVYDYVVIDCSPVGLVSDAYILAPLVDSTLFAVRRGKTNKSFFKSVVNQMKFDGIENVSIIFNDVKGREGYYGTSRYYGDKSYYLRKNSYYHDDYFES